MSRIRLLLPLLLAVIVDPFLNLSIQQLFLSPSWSSCVSFQRLIVPPLTHLLVQHVAFHSSPDCLSPSTFITWFMLVTRVLVFFFREWEFSSFLPVFTFSVFNVFHFFLHFFFFECFCFPSMALWFKSLFLDMLHPLPLPLYSFVHFIIIPVGSFDCTHHPCACCLLLTAYC